MDRDTPTPANGLLIELRHRNLRVIVGIIVLLLPLEVSMSTSTSVTFAGITMLVVSVLASLLWALRLASPKAVGTTIVVAGSGMMLIRLVAMLAQAPVDSQSAHAMAGALGFQTFVVPCLAAALLWRPNTVLLLGSTWLAVVSAALFAVPGSPNLLTGPTGSGELVQLLVYAAMTLLALNVLSNATHRLQLAEASARSASQTDELTAVPNRRGLQDTLVDAIDRAGTLPRWGVLMVDIDHFKRINDHLGHDVGDIALQAVASTIKGALRRGDVVGRWGGEEFLLVAADIDAAGLSRLAERIRCAVAEIRLPGEESLTISLGATLVQAGDTRETVIARADQALYAAKTQGRNRVVVDGQNGHREHSSLPAAERPS